LSPDVDLKALHRSSQTRGREARAQLEDTAVSDVVELRRAQLLVHVIMNAYEERLDFEPPAVGGGGAISWLRWTGIPMGVSEA